MALQQIDSLSGGQKSRVAFAVLCGHNPNFLVLGKFYFVETCVHSIRINWSIKTTLQNFMFTAISIRKSLKHRTYQPLDLLKCLSTGPSDP